MRVLVTGANGQLGSEVYDKLTKDGMAVVATDIHACSIFSLNYYQKCDITKDDDVEMLFLKVNPDIVVHCAAWTNVDKAETIENRDVVYSINVQGTRNIVTECQRYNAKLLYISTDYVFNGNGIEPWNPDDEDFGPLNYYGMTKLEGEKIVRTLLKKFFIVRTSWVFGKNGNNFVKTMLSLAKSHDTLRVVDDQIGSPTFVPDLANLFCEMIATDKYGIYHATNSGDYISWYDFACEIFRQKGIDINVIPVSTEEYGLSEAKRPRNSRMSKEKLVDNGFTELPDWKDAVRRYLQNDER